MSFASGSVRLADGADPDLLDDLREMPFGSYGHLADRFSIDWFFKGESRSRVIDNREVPTTTLRRAQS